MALTALIIGIGLFRSRHHMMWKTPGRNIFTGKWSDEPEPLTTADLDQSERRRVPKGFLRGAPAPTPTREESHMKRIVIAGSVAAVAALGLATPASAAPSEQACFGQVHKTVNSGGLPGFDNVGQLVQALGGGQEKNAVARSLCQ